MLFLDLNPEPDVDVAHGFGTGHRYKLYNHASV